MAYFIQPFMEGKTMLCPEGKRLEMANIRVRTMAKRLFLQGRITLEQACDWEMDALSRLINHRDEHHCTAMGQ